MSVRQMARRYAQALADVTESRGEQVSGLEELREVRRLFEESADLREVFATPAVSRPQKEDLLRAILDKAQLSQAIRNFLLVLLRNQRLGQLSEIVGQYAVELDARQGIVPVEVQATRPLTEDEQRQLQNRFERLTGRKVRMTFTQDDQLIGGILARFGSEVYDGSVRAHLRGLRQQLTR